MSYSNLYLFSKLQGAQIRSKTENWHLKTETETWNSEFRLAPDRNDPNFKILEHTE